MKIFTTLTCLLTFFSLASADSFANGVSHQKAVESAIRSCDLWFKKSPYTKISNGLDVPMKLHIPFDNAICVDGNFSNENSRIVYPELEKFSPQKIPYSL